MQKIVFINILFISSLLLLFPLIQSNDEVTILPLSQTVFQQNVSTPSLVFSLAEKNSITMNISKFDLNDNSLDLIHENIEFDDQITINFDKPGIYFFEVESSSINTLVIASKSIYTSSIVIISTLGSLNVIYYLLNLRNDNI